MIIGSLFVLFIGFTFLLLLAALVYRFFYNLFHPRANGGSRKRKKEGEVSIDYVPPRPNPQQAKEEAMKKAEAAAEDVEFEEIN